MKESTIIGPFKQLLPMGGLSLKGAISDSDLPVLSDAGILVSGTRMASVDNFNDLEKNHPDAQVFRLDSEYVGLPGFIDSHSHICFGGTRANDYALRNAGKSYLEIAKAGGGIWDTVTQTRKADQDELVNGIIKRAEGHLKNGTTTLEVKSGYGLTVAEELKMLRAIRQANASLSADLVPTCLAAHMLPKDFNGNAVQYLEMMASELFPLLKREKLADRIDAFVEESAFSPQQIAPYFQKAKQMGFDITVHGDQFTTGGSEVAVSYGAVSADHLEVSTETEIELLAKSDTIATALPGATLGLGCGFAPARRILDAGGALAVATDHNPGSAPMGDLLMQAAVLGTFEKLTNAEVLAGITFRAAATLRLLDRGRLTKGSLADIAIFQTDNYKEILYHQGTLKPCMVWKNGKLKMDRRNLKG